VLAVLASVGVVVSGAVGCVVGASPSVVEDEDCAIVVPFVSGGVNAGLHPIVLSHAAIVNGADTTTAAIRTERPPVDSSLYSGDVRVNHPGRAMAGPGGSGGLWVGSVGSKAATFWANEATAVITAPMTETPNTTYGPTHSAM
jgi:hypothetical protein